MFWGLIMTFAALALMIVLALTQIYRIDRVIEQVDRELGNKDADGDK